MYYTIYVSYLEVPPPIVRIITEAVEMQNIK